MAMTIFACSAHRVCTWGTARIKDVPPYSQPLREVVRARGGPFPGTVLFPVALCHNCRFSPNSPILHLMGGQYEGELTRLVDELNRSARREKTDDKALLDQLLETAVQRKASDLLLVAGSPALLRVNGSLTTGVGRVMTDSDVRGALLPVLSAEQQNELQHRRSLDFSFVANRSAGFAPIFTTSGVRSPPRSAFSPSRFRRSRAFTCPPAWPTLRNVDRAWCC